MQIKYETKLALCKCFTGIVLKNLCHYKCKDELLGKNGAAIDHTLGLLAGFTDG